MNKDKIRFITESNEIYLNEILKKNIKEMGLSDNDFIENVRWDKSSVNSGFLFTKPFVLLNLTEDKHLREFNELCENFLKAKDNQDKFEKKKEEYSKKNNKEYKYTNKEIESERDRKRLLENFQNDFYRNGIIIIGKESKSSILKWVEYFQGLVVSSGKKADGKKDEILKNIPLSKEMRNFVEDYAGDEYDILVLFKNNLEGLSQETIKNINYSDIYIYLPNKPGSIPPWNLTNSIMNLDFNLTLENLERVTKTTSIFAVLPFLKNKMKLLYDYVILEKEGIKDSEKVKLLKLKNEWSFIDIKNLKKKRRTLPSEEVCQHICQILYKLETNIRGGKNLKGIVNDYVEMELIKIMLCLKNDMKIGAGFEDRSYK